MDSCLVPSTHECTEKCQNSTSALQKGQLKERFPFILRYSLWKWLDKPYWNGLLQKWVTFSQKDLSTLGLVKCFVLNYNLAPHELQKWSGLLVNDFQINFPCIDPKQVDHLKVLWGSLEQFGNSTYTNIQIPILIPIIFWLNFNTDDMILPC